MAAGKKPKQAKGRARKKKAPVSNRTQEPLRGHLKVKGSTRAVKAEIFGDKERYGSLTDLKPTELPKATVEVVGSPLSVQQPFYIFNPENQPPLFVCTLCTQVMTPRTAYESCWRGKCLTGRGRGKNGRVKMREKDPIKRVQNSYRNASVRDGNEKKKTKLPENKMPSKDIRESGGVNIGDPVQAFFADGWYRGEVTLVTNTKCRVLFEDGEAVEYSLRYRGSENEDKGFFVLNRKAK